MKLDCQTADRKCELEQAQPQQRSGPGPTSAPNRIAVTLLTGGSDRPYVWGLSTELLSKGVSVDLIGSDELDFPQLRNIPALHFLNLRGDQGSKATLTDKIRRVLTYYVRLLGYAASAKPKIFHVLWNNKFEVFDRTALMLYYKILGKAVVLTAHNVNTGKRDTKDSFTNRLTLKVQYRLSDHIFVHTPKMKDELIDVFDVRGDQVSVIPFGINNSIPNTHLSISAAKRRLGIRNNEKTILFFGRITPYKGLEYLMEAFRLASSRSDDYRLVIAGRLDAATGEKYWAGIRETFRGEIDKGKVLAKTEFIPDDQTELYFKAADVLVLPYRDIYQSGVLFLAHSFGLPVLAADVGSLKDDIVEGETGFIFRTEDSADLAMAIERYFESDLFRNLDDCRRRIQDYVAKRHSWDAVGLTTVRIYSDLLRSKLRGRYSEQGSPRVPA
jgi:D-inositol-3-phosphate glycosyltransferase